MRRRIDLKKRIHKQPKAKFNLLGRVNVFKYLSILIVILFILFIPNIIQKLIKIDRIECISQYGECLSVLGISLTNVSDYKTTKKGLEDVLKQNASVGSYVIQYKIPNTIKLNLVLYKPKYAVKNQNGTYFLVSNDGVVFQVTSESLLPTLIVNESNFKIGDMIPNSYIFALKIIEKVKILYTIRSAVLEKSELKIQTDNNLLIRFPIEGDVDVLVGGLRLIFSRLNEGSQGIRMEDVGEIDLRFKNPILKVISYSNMIQQ